MSIYLTTEVRRQMIHNVKGLFPFTPSYQIRQITEQHIITHSPHLIPLILKQIIRDPAILDPNTLNIGYTIKEMVPQSPSQIEIPIPAIYSLNSEHIHINSTKDLNETEYNYIPIALPTHSYLPHCHHIATYRNSGELLLHYNKIELEGELLNRYINLIEAIHKDTIEKIENNDLIIGIKQLLPLFTTTKQLMNQWPEMEQFLPNNKVHKAMDQKKAKPILLRKGQTDTINKINKQIFIRRLTTTNGV